MPNGVRRSHDPNGDLEFVRGEGVYLRDSEGRQYLDFVCGFSSTNFGHAQPRLVQVAREQLAVLTQIVGLQHPWRKALEAKLAAFAPMSRAAKVWLATSGARAIEVAWKIAYAYRPGKILAFDLAYHGRSIATAQISDTARLPILQAPLDRLLFYPRCLACPVGLERTSCNAECFDSSETWIENHASDVSAIVVEPAIGARGYYYAPPVFFQRLERIARRLGIVLIDDEIQMGFGRLGTIFACEKQGWEPDIAILGKSLGGGIVPIAALVGRADIMDSLQAGYESETFAANPLACRIALESIKLLVDENLLERAKQIEAWLTSGLHALKIASKHPILVDAMGASGIIEIMDLLECKMETMPSNRDRNHFRIPSQHISAADIARRWVVQAREAGLLVHLSGEFRNRIVLIPPLIAERNHIEGAFEILMSIVGRDLCR